MGCGCGGGGPTFTGSPGGVYAAQGTAEKWRVSWNHGNGQEFRDWDSQLEAFAHAGVVGGTVSRAFNQ